MILGADFFYPTLTLMIYSSYIPDGLWLLFYALLRPLVKSVYQKIFFLFLNQNVCYGYSKELSQWDGSFEHQKHMLKLMGKKIFTIL